VHEPRNANDDVVISHHDSVMMVKGKVCRVCAVYLDDNGLFPEER